MPDEVCGGLGVDGGKRCTHEVIEVVGDVPLCLLHRSRLVKELIATPRPVMTLPFPPVVRAEVGTADRNIVYYLGDPDTSLVKIGTTMRLFKRLTSLRRHRPRLLLLATEPGNHSLETRRHYQFRSLHHPLPNGEREWYRKAPVLMEHIGQIRMKHGILLTDRLPRLSWVAPLKAPRTPVLAGNNSVEDWTEVTDR